MGKRYLIDTNILIYFLNDALPETSHGFIDSIMDDDFNISVISKIELLGWKNHTSVSYHQAEQFIDNATLIDLNQAIVQQSIKLKRQYTIKLPDAIIAAACLVNGLDLITRNTDDFKQITTLSTINPFDM